MAFDFMSDLDEYFCEKYANYDKLCILPDYRMPKMQETTKDEFGRSYSYTLPADRMRLSLQEKKAELLAALKEQMADKSFSFSFRPLGFWAWVRDRFSKYSFKKLKGGVFSKYSLTDEQTIEGIEIAPEIWKKICKGGYYPTKNLIFSIALVHGISYEDTDYLLRVCDYGFDFTEVRDVVIAYLLSRKVTNRMMQKAALDEYAVENLFIKE